MSLRKTKSRDSKKVLAALLAFTLIGGALPANTSVFGALGTSITAHADDETGNYIWDEGTQTLTFKGEITRQLIDEINYTEMQANTLYIKAEPGTVFPENCSYLFQDFTNTLEVDFSDVDTSNVVNMEGMFACMGKVKSIDLSGFDTSNVTNMMDMFYDCRKLTDLDISSFDTSNVKTMLCMFMLCKSLPEISVSHFDVSQTVNMVGMFSECNSLTELDLSEWEFNSDIVDVMNMFNNCNSLKTIYISEWELKEPVFVESNNSMTDAYMFRGCTSLVGGNGTAFDGSKTDSEYALIDKEGQAGYFTYKSPRFTLVEAKDATCTEDGNKAYYTDSENPDNWYADKKGKEPITDHSSVIISKKGHSLTDTVVEPTCTENGYTEHKCSVCDFVTTDDETEALGHDWSDWAASTDSEDKETRTCNRCGETESRDKKSEKKNALGDLNGDGQVDIEDVVIIINHIIGNKSLTDEQFPYADVDKNGEIDIADVAAVINQINGVKTLE